MIGRAPLLTAAELAAIRAPIGSARTMPSRAFTSVSFFERERSLIAQRNWLAVCFAEELSDPGDASPIDVWGVPIAVLRDQRGTLRAFHNICSYDGCPVLTETRRGTESLTARYHGWRYDLDGKLVEAPYWAGSPSGGSTAVAAEHRRLVEIEVAEALGIVFVNVWPGVDKPSFDEHVAPLIALLAEVDIGALSLARTSRNPIGTSAGGPIGTSAGGNDSSVDVFETVVKTNWKTFAENDCLNILHESFTHAMYAASPAVPRVSAEGTPLFEVICDQDLIGFSYAESDAAGTYPEIDLPHIGLGRRPERGFFVQLYPNVSIAMMPNLVAPIIQFPEQVGCTRIRGATLVHRYVAGPEHAYRRDAVDRLFSDAAAEDTLVIEAIQAGRRSPVRETGFYSPFWDRPHHAFSIRVAADLDTDHR